MSLSTIKYKKWSQEEDDSLINEITLNIDINDISIKHNRTVSAIKNRMNKLNISSYKTKKHKKKKVRKYNIFVESSDDESDSQVNTNTYTTKQRIDLLTNKLDNILTIFKD